MSQQRAFSESAFGRRRDGARARFFRPRLEQLEDRTVPANSLFHVAGTPDQFVTIRFNWVSRGSDSLNEVGVYVVDDAQGTVNGVAPGDPSYARTVMRDDSRQVLFDSGTGVGNQRTLSFQGGSTLAFYLIPGTTRASFLAHNPTNQAGSAYNALFSVDAANSDGLDHVARDKQSGPGEFRWEDMVGGGDRDYDDVIYRAKVVSIDTVPRADGFQGRALMTPGVPSQSIHTTFRLLRRQSMGEIGLFQVDAADGRIGGLKPGDPGYLRAALDRARRQILFGAGQGGGAKELDLRGGSFFGLYLIDRGSAAGFLATNPQNRPGGGPNAFVSFFGANPDRSDHVRQLFDRTVGFETDLGADNPDFLDTIVNFNFGGRIGGGGVSGDTTGPTLAARLANDLGLSNSDGITSDSTIVGSVTDLGGVAALRAGFGVTADVDITDLLQPDGSFQISSSRMAAINGGALPEGTYRLRLQAVDRAGNSSFFDVNFRLLANPTAVGPIGTQSVGANSTTSLNLFSNFVGPDFTNTLVKWDFEDFNDVGVEFFDVTPPAGGRLTKETVNNLLNYVNSGSYQNSIIQRVPTGFVAQGGGFFLPTSNANPNDGVNPLDRIATNAPVDGQVGNANVQGTIAMALSGNPPDQDSGTSQYFFNLRNNTANLDPNFTVFGRVTSGLSVLTNDIESVPKFNVPGVTNGEVSMPIINNPNLPANPSDPVDISGLTRDNFVVINDVVVTQRRDALQFTATSNNTNVATVQIDPQRPNFLQITGVSTGQATITIIATGPSGIATSSFIVNVS